MCAVSNVGDEWTRKIHDWTQMPISIPENSTSFRLGQLEEKYEELRKEVLKMKNELEAAREQDVREGNADCEMEEKVELLKKFAEMFGVDLSKAFPND